MRKSILSMLLLMSMLLVLCAACGGDDAPVASVSATMAPTAEPVVEAEVIPAPEAEVTPEPVEEEPVEEPVEEEPVQEPEEEAAEPTQKPQESTGNNSGTTQSKPEPTAKPEPTPEPVVDKFAVAQNMAGSMVEDLYAAIGRPNGADYTTSCLVFDGQDGLLYYDGFTVSTVKYADGTEMVMGAY